MEPVLAYSTLALTVSLAIARPRIAWGLRFTPGLAALLGVALLALFRLLSLEDLLSAAVLQWRPLLALTCIMVMTGVVREVGAFERLAARIEAFARRTSATRAFTVVFAASVITSSLLNNDAAILVLTPLVVALTRRLYPNRPDATIAFAFAVFLAPGVAPFVISNPMNMIVAEFAGIGFNAYARVMAPISLVGALLTFVVLRLWYRRLFASLVVHSADVAIPARHSAERPLVAILVAVFAAYPLMSALGAPIWPVSVGGALACVMLAHRYRVATSRRIASHVSPDILLFLWGVFLVVVGLKHVGVVDHMAHAYATMPSGSPERIGAVGAIGAIGSAVVDNHPMALLNMMALNGTGDQRALLAALVGGDIGPRLLPIGSLAGLLWMDLLRRAGVDIRTGTFVRLGTLVLLPTLTVSLVMLALIAGH